MLCEQVHVQHPGACQAARLEAQLRPGNVPARRILAS